MTPAPRLFWTALALAAPAAAALALLLTINALTLRWAMLAFAAALCLAVVIARTLVKSLADSPSAAGAEPTVAHRAPEEAALETLHDPLILLDRDRRVVRANRAARDLLGAHLPDRDLAAGLRHPLVLEAVDAALGGAPEQVVQFNLPGPVDRMFLARVTPFPRHSNAAEAIAAILALQDITALKRSEQMRDDFVANVSHELRTPLSALVGFIETIRGPARDDPEAQERFLAIMQEQTSRMARLVTDLLSLARIEQNEHTPPRGLVDIAALLTGVAASLELKARSRDMGIRLELPDGLPPVVGDQDQLIQVFQNLIDNALKYGREGSEVRVAVDPPIASAKPGRAAPMLSISVKDQGDGIPREHLPRLTERFYRIDAARSRSMGGTGLGLAIVKHVVNRHRGRLSIDSEVGQGSSFTVQLPTAAGRPDLDNSKTLPTAGVTQPS